MAQKNLPHRPQNTDFSVVAARERIEKAVFSNVAHDLKTPLACIIGALEIYERMDAKLSPEKKLVLINTALQEAYKLDGTLSTMLEHAAPK